MGSTSAGKTENFLGTERFVFDLFTTRYKHCLLGKRIVALHSTQFSDSAPLQISRSSTVCKSEGERLKFFQ